MLTAFHLTRLKFELTGSITGADGLHQFAHLFSVRLEIFLSLHLEIRKLCVEVVLGGELIPPS